MSSIENSLFQIANALPDYFQFYDYGTIEAQTAPSQLDFTHAVKFNIFGDLEALLVVLFSKDLDPSIYSEVGNILASQAVSQLNRQKELGIMISPPEVLTEKQIGIILEMKQAFITRPYAHLIGDQMIPLEILILPISYNGAGYA
jgi:hypothetical protein